MNKLLSALFAAALITVPFSAMAEKAGDDTQDLGVQDKDSWVKNFRMHNKQMDTDRDGMISQKEYMTHQEMMWENVRKNQDGLATMHDMNGMYAGTTKGNKLRPSGEPETPSN